MLALFSQNVKRCYPRREYFDGDPPIKFIRRSAQEISSSQEATISPGITVIPHQSQKQVQSHKHEQPNLDQYEVQSK